MRDIIKKGKSMVMVHMFGQINLDILVNGKIIKSMVTGHTNGSTGECTRDNGPIIICNNI